MAIKALVVLLVGLVLASVHLAEAQQPTKVFRIGYLSSTSSERQKSRLVAFQQGLYDLGYVEGKNIIIEYRSDDRYERMPELVAELVRLNVDVLVAAGAPAAHAAKNATKTIPIVMQSGDPVGTGLVASLARPGGNITGLSDFTVGVVTKRLELLKEVVPSVSRVAVLWNPTNPTNPVTLKETRP
jgi:putative tryptophan/tyrosine transport system substrate-binding protein